MSKKMYFFTSSFPFGRGESFIENEICFLAKAFANITIIPLYCYDKNGIKRDTPANCKVLSPVITSRWRHYFLGLFCLQTFRLFIREFFCRRVYTRITWIKMFLIAYCTTNSLLRSKTVRRILQDIQIDDLIYFYWGRGASDMLPFIPNTPVKKVVRFHNWDLYDYIYGGYIPLQEAILKKADVSVFISKHGQDYMKNKYSHFQLNSVVSYLGTFDFGIAERSTDNLFRLLSCSNVSPIKRVFLIYEALQSITGYEIEWTHIGDGPDFEKLKNVVQNTRKNIRVKLPGRIPNQKVIMYYQTNMIDAFINVSTSEGLPVSLMEAISFNVPVIGTDVGGTSEIVTPQTGILLPSDPTVVEIADALKEIRNLKSEPRLFWKRNFNSIDNYPKFINEILS